MDRGVYLSIIHVISIWGLPEHLRIKILGSSLCPSAAVRVLQPQL